MIPWIQPVLDSDSSPYVVDSDLQVNLEYPVGLLCISTLPHKPVTQVILVADIDGKALVAVPKSVWHRKVAQRTMPLGWVTKMTSLETIACRPDAKSEPMEDTSLRFWVGFLNSDVVGEVDMFQDQYDAEYLFDPQLLPFVKRWQMQPTSISLSFLHRKFQSLRGRSPRRASMERKKSLDL